MCMGILKDQAFAKQYGTGDPKPAPVMSLAVWFLRDVITLGAAVTLPDVLGPMLQPDSPRAGKAAVTVVLPAVVQLITTPLHRLGFDVYNRPDANGWTDRLKFVSRDYWRFVGVRLCRVLPAYSLGTLLSREIRTTMASYW
jgi:hypothetical protein